MLCVNTSIDHLSPAVCTEDSQQRQWLLPESNILLCIFALKDQLTTHKLEGGRSLLGVIIINKHAPHPTLRHPPPPSCDDWHVTSCVWPARLSPCRHMMHSHHNTKRAHGKTLQTRPALHHMYMQYVQCEFLQCADRVVKHNY